MAYDKSSTLYHLTPGGWVVGDERPPEAVESWRRDTNQASQWSKEYIDWTCEWANPEVSRDARDEIRHRHREFMGRPGRTGGLVTSIGNAL